MGKLKQTSWSHPPMKWQQSLPDGMLFVLDSYGSSDDTPTRRSSSGAALLSTLIPVFGVAVASLVAFHFLRRTNRHLYSPRSTLDTIDDVERTPASDSKLAYLKLKDFDLLEKQSLDAYLFLRFLKLIILICFVGLCLSWPILLPLNVTGGGKSKGLDRLTVGNIKDPNRYYAHLFISWIFLGFVMFTITRETLFYINLRQAYLLTPWNSSRISSRTVLFTSVPKRELDEDHVHRTFDSVKRVWIINDFSSAKDLTEKRDDTARALELSLVKASQNAVKKSSQNQTYLSKAKALVSGDGRPTRRSTPLFGKKDDAIEWNKDRLIQLEQRLDATRDGLQNGAGTKTGAMFVEFETLSAAQAAMQMTSSTAPLVMTPRCIATVPKGIVWENIGFSAWQIILRENLAIGFIVALTIFWSIPTSFVGVLSNITDIADKVSWLHWINNLPSPVLGAIEGLLPSLLLSYLVSLVPMICRYVARLSGEVTTAQIELKTQEWYFIFQVIQVFLVTTFSSGATAVIIDIINEPKLAPELLARKLPKASNFYLSYFIIYGFGQSTKNLMNWSGLFFDKFFGFFDVTPRDKYERYTSMSGTGWGSWYPKFTNLAIIAISYSCIAPLTLGFATIAFSVLYLVFRYNLFYVLNTSVDTQGQAFAKALQQLTVGVYTAELCLIGLFSLSVNRHGGSSGPLFLMILFTILTILYHRIMHKELNPLTKTLPSSIVHRNDLDFDGELGDEEADPLLAGTKPRDSPSGILGRIFKFFEPQKYASFEANYKALVATRLGEPVPHLSKEQEDKAYLPPAQTSKSPILWIAKDDTGVSKKEIESMHEDLEVTEEGAWINASGKVEIDKGALRELPIWQKKIYY